MGLLHGVGCSGRTWGAPGLLRYWDARWLCTDWRRWKALGWPTGGGEPGNTQPSSCKTETRTGRAPLSPRDRPCPAFPKTKLPSSRLERSRGAAALSESGLWEGDAPGNTSVKIFHRVYSTANSARKARPDCPYREDTDKGAPVLFHGSSEGKCTKSNVKMACVIQILALQWMHTVASYCRVEIRLFLVCCCPLTESLAFSECRNVMATVMVKVTKVVLRFAPRKPW